MLLDDLDLSKAPAMKRARSGVARSFQSLELFDDSTVFENLSVAADPQDLRSYLLDLIWPINPPLPPEVVRAITEFDLDDGPPSRRAGPVLREAATAGHRPGGGDASRACSCSMSRWRVSARPRARELARVVRRLADDWGMAILVVEHDMNFVMGVCDQVVVLDFGS